MNKSQGMMVGLLGVIFIVFAFFYFAFPASSLPSFLPGHQAGLSIHHYKHGIAALFLGLGCFAYGWFKSGKKSTPQK